MTSQYDLLSKILQSDGTDTTLASYGATDSGHQTAQAVTPASTLQDEDRSLSVFRVERVEGGKAEEETSEELTKHFQIDSESESENDNDDGKVLKEVRNK